jgi:pimeloyl-ACP methyl ester carboxylesterase
MKPTKDRRYFLQATALAFAADQVGAASGAPAKKSAVAARASFASSLKQVNVGLLNVGYIDEGPVSAPAVILLHGWPYDIHSFVDVTPRLVDAGFRVLVPYLRGYGSTRFLSNDSMRNGQQSAVATDIVDFMNALGIQKAVLAGFDWGARTAVAIGALWPERCRALVSVSGYLITNLKLNQQPLPPAAELGWWYQYYFATERGRLGYEKNRREFARLIWKIASPKWQFDDATFDRSASAFDNPDHVSIVIHNYRWRLGLAEGESRYAAIEDKLQQAPSVVVPSITIGSDFDGPAADGKSYAAKFSGAHSHRMLEGIGHNVPQEAPEAFAAAVIDASRAAGHS